MLEYKNGNMANFKYCGFLKIIVVESETSELG
jgi:hypothetical protein